MSTALIIAETVAKVGGGIGGVYAAQVLWRRLQSRENRSSRQENKREDRAQSFTDARIAFLEAQLSARDAAFHARVKEMTDAHQVELRELDERLHARHAEALSAMQADLRKANEGRLRDHRAIVSGAEALGDTTEAIEHMVGTIADQMQSTRTALEAVTARLGLMHDMLRLREAQADTAEPLPTPPPEVT